MALAATALGTGGVLAAGAPASAAPIGTGQQPVCPPAGEVPDVTSGSPLYTDSNIAVFVGGNLHLGDGVAESEGLNVVLGDAVLGSNFGSLGWVGGGSQVVPADGSAMLLVGGDLTVEAPGGLNVGHVDGTENSVGGEVRIGGSLLSGTVNAPLTQHDAGAVDGWSDFGSTINSVSDTLAGQKVTGSVTVNGAQLHLTGDDSLKPQIFTLKASTLSSIKYIFLNDIKQDSNGGYPSIIINVTGTSAIDFTPNFWNINGGPQLDSSSKGFGNLASAVLWNFQDTTDLTLGTNDQFVGSVLAPQPKVQAQINTSTNGRLYIGGDLSMSGATGSGLEHHNYAWTGGHGFECEATPGSVTPPTPTPAPATPTVTEPTCVDGENHGPSLVLAKSDGVTYKVDGDIKAGSTVTVTATASTGHTLTPTDGWTIATDGTTATWVHTFADEACTAPTDPGINQGGSGGNSAGGTDPAGTTDPTSTSTGTGTGTGSTTDTTVAADTAVTAASGTKTTAPAKTAAGSNGALAVTGSDLAIPAGLAAALLALGVLLLFARRRKTAE